MSNGDCNGLLECQTFSSTPPNTLAEYALNQNNNKDFFDISLVEGFNIPMEFSPVSADECSVRIRCTADIIGQCPNELRTPGGCNNPCTVFKTNEYCCTSGNCGPTNYSRFFKDRCSTSYSYPRDDSTSTFTCPSGSGTNYRVVINMVEVAIYFHHGVNEYIDKLGFVGVQELIVLAPTGKYFEIIGDEGVRTLTSFISTDYKSIHLFATEDCELSVDVPDIVMHDGSFLLSPIVNEGTYCSESEDDTKNVELVVVKSDKRRLRYICVAEGCPFLLLISGDLTTPGVSVKTLVDHIECGTTYDNSLVDYSTIALYFKDKLQSDPKRQHRVFELNVSEAKCKRAKKEILESLEGSFVGSYNKLEGYATELRSCNPWSDIVIDLSKEALSNGKRKFLRMYICFKEMKLGFKSGLRPFIGLDGTFLKGKAKRQTKRTWTWFMQHLQHSLELQNGEELTFISDMQKQQGQYYLKHIRDIVQGILRQIDAKDEVKSSFTEEFEDQFQEIKEVDEEAGQDLIDKYPPKTWYKPTIEMLEDIRVKIMERLAAKEVVVRKWKDDGFSPKSELLFIEYLKISKVCKVSGSGDNGYEAMEHKKIIPKKEIDWYYSKEATLAVYKHKSQLVRGEPFWKFDHLHAIEPPELVKQIGRPKLMREKENNEVVKRQEVWKQTRKGKVMTCSNCGEQNHNARGCEKEKKLVGEKRQPRRCLVYEDEASEEVINCTVPQPT
ncbi:hypothetical protein H5410_062931 [Solanum commersonii]|uniref:Uncharacterized protein n=1 Tax=Solanum commersonii TaxID=4109 RepID=A0A9J5WCB7_SOLCO|nr:hypothetical protein H5410_062931 [Solanum commersonii]